MVYGKNAVLLGMASVTVPIYIAEATPPHLRGPLVSLNQAFISGGMFVSLLVSGAFCPLSGGWRWVSPYAASSLASLINWGLAIYGRARQLLNMIDQVNCKETISELCGTVLEYGI